jgi:hypothetical protein
MNKRTLEEALADLPARRRGEAESRARQAIIEEARAAFLDAAMRYCHEIRNSLVSSGPLGDMRQAYGAMLLAWRDSPEGDRERARIDALLSERQPRHS